MSGSSSVRLNGASSKAALGGPGSDAQLKAIIIGTPSLGASIVIYDNAPTGVSTANSSVIANIDAGQLGGQRVIEMFDLRLRNGGVAYFVGGGGNGEATIVYG